MIPDEAKPFSAPYDSRPASWEHIDRVRQLLREIAGDLSDRGSAHDRSKLVDPEKAMFDTFTPRLAGLAYGSDEYRECLAEMLADGGLQHHYAENDHHPEHFTGGLADMNLLQILEMLADWKAAGERHANGGDLAFSITSNAARFGYDEQMSGLLMRTAEYLGWL